MFHKSLTLIHIFSAERYRYQLFSVLNYCHIWLFRKVHDLEFRFCNELAGRIILLQKVAHRWEDDEVFFIFVLRSVQLFINAFAIKFFIYHLRRGLSMKKWDGHKVTASCTSLVSQNRLKFFERSITDIRLNGLKMWGLICVDIRLFIWAIYFETDQSYFVEISTKW